MAEATAPESTDQPANANEVKVEDLGPTRRLLTITVPAASVDERIGDSFDTLAHETSLPGFRKGRAPRKLLERRFGGALRKEARSQLIADAYSTALEEQEIRAVGEPELDEADREGELEPGKPLTFTIEVEVVPEFDVPSFDGIEIKKPLLEIGDEHIDQELLRQRLRLGAADRIEGGPFEGLDRMVGRANVVRDGEDEPFFETENALVVMPDEEQEGRGQVLGLMIEGLDAILGDRKVGDTITIETVGPEGHEREDIRGKKLTITYTITDAERITPASVEDVIARYGLGTEENLREQLRFGIEQRRDVEQRGAMRQQVSDKLLELVNFDLREKLSERQVARSLERQRMELLYRGAEAEDVERHLAQVRETSEEQAKNRLRLFFILHRVADQFEIEVTDAEINSRVASMAMQQGERPERMRAELARTGRLNELAIAIREHKAADRLIDQATVVEVPSEEWNAEAEAKSAGGGSKKKTTRKTSKKNTKKASGTAS